MKKILLFTLLATLVWTVNGQNTTPNPAPPKTADADEDEPVRLTDNNILFFYEANADIPSTMESVAKCFSADYRNAPTEFAKVDILKQISPVIDRKIADAKGTKAVMVSLSCQIPDYDFTRKGFATTMTVESFVPFNLNGANYAVAFKGIKNFTFLALPEERAAQYQGKLARSREGQVQIFGTISSAEEQTLNYGTRKTVFLKVRRLVFSLADGTTIGEITLPVK